MRFLPALLIAVSLVACLSPGPNRARAAADRDVYQIVRATENRVWRLNKRTGEISVCTLERGNLVCTTSSKAITPPTRSYEQLEAEKRRADAEAEKRREAKRAKDLQFLDRVIAAFRILIGAAIEHDNGK